MQNRLDLTGRVAIVTGAGTAGSGFGNGKATSVLLARHGAKILAVDTVLERLNETAGLIRDEGGAVEILQADVTQFCEVEEIPRKALAAFGRLDILVNNVGGSEPGDCVSMEQDVWRRQIDLNLTSVFLVTKCVLPHMIDSGKGSIVNLSSIAALRYLGRDNVAYSAAKAGVIEFSRQVALRHATEGIRCNTVVPGLLHTPLLEGRLATQYAGGHVSKLIAAREAQIPMGKAGDAWDVAYAALYLASDASSHVTATEIIVDGGMAAATLPYRIV